MTNWEYIIKNNIKDILIDTISKMTEAVKPEEWEDAEEQGMTVQWLLKERREKDSVQLSEDKGS